MTKAQLATARHIVTHGHLYTAAQRLVAWATLRNARGGVRQYRLQKAARAC